MRRTIPSRPWVPSVPVDLCRQLCLQGLDCPRLQVGLLESVHSCLFRVGLRGRVFLFDQPHQVVQPDQDRRLLH